jgi:hypothetical protein
VDVTEKVVWLSERAKQRSEERRAKAAAERIRQWKLIQDEAPEVAELLTNINKIFGKPAAVEVEINGEVVLQSGEFQPVRENLRYRREDKNEPDFIGNG